MELNHLEVDQEGMLRGGFSFLTFKECKHQKVNGNCDCNSRIGGCDGNANCDCNEPRKCSHNCNCNCDCGTTAPPAPDKTKPTDGTGQSLDGMGLFMF